MPEMITGDDACYAYGIVERICAEVGPGLQGSPQEPARAAIIARELESHLGAGNVAAEQFTVAPCALVSAYPVSGLFMLLAALMNIFVARLTGVSLWVIAIAGLVFSILSPLTFILQFVLNHELVDVILPKKQSVNVIGTLRRVCQAWAPLLPALKRRDAR